MAQLMYAGVKAVLRRDDGKILFVKQCVAAWPNGYLDLPGGRLDIGEDPYSALKREIFEETKLTASVGEPVGMYFFKKQDGNQVTLTVFECTCTDFSTLDLGDNADKTENLSEPQWLSPQEALARKGELIHESFARLLRKLSQQ